MEVIQEQLYNMTVTMVMYALSVNTKYLYNMCAMLKQHRRRWAGVVQMLYKYFVFAGLRSNIVR